VGQRGTTGPELWSVESRRFVESVRLGHRLSEFLIFSAQGEMTFIETLGRLWGKSSNARST
jgi:hypothetical protein